MEILFVSHKYPPATGGMEKQSFELINGLKPLAKVHSIVYEGSGSRLRFFFLLNRRIKQVLKQNPGITIIHFNDGLIAAVALFHRGYQQLKRTVTMHGLDVVFPGFIYQRVIFPLFNRFDLIFAVSRATKDACKERGIADSKIVVVNNGVDPKIRSEATRMDVVPLLQKKYGVNCDGKRILVAMGRPVKRKGFSWFISNVLPGLHPDFILLLIGPVQDQQSKEAKLLRLLPSFLKHKAELFLGYPSDERAIEGLIHESPYNDRVFRLGKLPLAEVVDILSCAEAFIMPNIEISGDMEGFGLVCLEACMCGTTVFASASGGITDAIIDHKNGFLLPSGHTDSWIQALNGLITDPQARQLTADSIVSYTARRFNWQKMAVEYLGHFLVLDNTPSE